MLSENDKYKTIKELEQGTKFYYRDEQYLKLPPHVECYGNPCNAVEIKTGTMMNIRKTMLVDMDTMIASENYYI